jgi:hypothetical protein
VTYEITDRKKGRGVYKRENEKEEFILKNNTNACKKNAYQQISCKINFMKLYRLFIKA